MIVAFPVCLRFYFDIVLTHLCLASHKRDIDKQCRPRSDAANAASDQGTLIAWITEVSINHSKIQAKPDTLLLEIDQSKEL